MHRNMSIVREILEGLATRESEASSAEIFVALPAFTQADILYHLQIMMQAHLITGRFVRNGDHRLIDARFLTLTWDGNELRDTLKDPDVWKKTESGIAKMGSWSIDLVSSLAKAYAKEIAMEKLGIKLV